MPLPGVRLLTLPLQHSYLDAVLPDSAVRVATGRPADLGWAPDPLWQVDRLREHLDEFDVAHVHFGFDHVDPGVLIRWAAALQSGSKGLVITVHDLRNPHHGSRERLDAQLDVLVPAADAVVTLTPGAAEVIRRRWGRDADVVAHPAVFAGPAADTTTEPGRVGVHLKSLRRNLVEPDATVLAVAAGVEAAGGRLVVDVHRDVADRPEIRRLRAALGDSVHVHGYLDDDALRAALTRLHVSVMVNRFGTHSGWLEACRDVGTAVVAPDCGFYDEQWTAAHLYRHNEADGLDAVSLSRAVQDALAAPAPTPADRADRLQVQAHARLVHAGIYASVMATPRS